MKRIIAEKVERRKQEVKNRARQLNIAYDKLSVPADGAHWIWDSVSLEFGKVQECLDVYHALEHLLLWRKLSPLLCFAT